MSFVNADGELDMPFVRSAYNYDRKAASKEVALICPEPTLTQQNMAEDVDINTIVKRFGLTGQLPENVSVPLEGDFTNVVDFQTALNVVRAAEDSFMQMPADVRERFGNDPQKFLVFAYDEKNRDEAKKLGLLLPDVVPPLPMEVAIVADKRPKDAGPVST